MKVIYRISIFLLCAAALIAAAAVLPFLAPPLRGEGMVYDVNEQIGYDGTIAVVVRGESVRRPGTYRVPYDSTYADVFALAGAETVPPDLDPDAPIGFSDAVLVGDIFYIYLVL